MLAAVFFAAGIALTDGNAVFLLLPIVSLPFLRRDLALWLALCALFAFGVCSFSLARARTSVFSFAAGEYELVGTIEEIGADSVTLTVEPGYRYALEVSFEQGIAMYVFTVA